MHRHSEMFSILKCTICKEVSKGPSGLHKIMHCPQNHPVCAECLNRITGQKRCPVCREDIIGRANTLEKVAELLNKPLDHEQEAGKAPKTITQTKLAQPKRLTLRRYLIGISPEDETRGQDDERRHNIRINKDVTTSSSVITIV